MQSESTLYPMMGVGVFYIMFWVGFVVGHNIGLACGGMLLTGFLFGGGGSYGVVKLERYNKGASRPRETKQQQPAEIKPAVKPVLQA